MPVENIDYNRKVHKIDFFINIFKIVNGSRINFMKNKLLLIAAFMFVGMGVSAFAQDSVPDMADVIQKYKEQNYVGSLQDAMEITQKDPANALAHYYLGISYAQIGDKDKALDSYRKVIDLSTNYTLKEYAERGELCINNPSECQRSGKKEVEIDDELAKFIKSAKSFSKDVSDKIDDLQIELMKQNINKDVDKKSEMPTDEEIAQAVKTLAKVGINPLSMGNNGYVQAQNSLTQNPEYMQLQMLLGNNNQNNGNDFMSMLPYFMSQGSSKNPSFSAEAMKNMMMSSMIGNLNTTFDFNDK